MTAWPGPITTASVRLDLPSQTMSSTTGTCQACGDDGVVPPFAVEITCISKQYQVSGWSGVCLPAGDWDGEWDGTLPDASHSLGPFQPFSGVRVWSSI